MVTGTYTAAEGNYTAETTTKSKQQRLADQRRPEPLKGIETNQPGREKELTQWRTRFQDWWVSKLGREKSLEEKDMSRTVDFGRSEKTSQPKNIKIIILY